MPVLPATTAAATALDLVDAEVRELVRRRGLDPAVDPGPVRTLVREVVADYAERSLSSSLPPLADAEGVLRDVLDRVAGFGPFGAWVSDGLSQGATPADTKTAGGGGGGGLPRQWLEAGLERLTALRHLEVDLSMPDWDNESKLAWCRQLQDLGIVL